MAVRDYIYIEPKSREISPTLCITLRDLQGGNIMAVGIGVFAVSAIISYEIEKRLPSVKKN